MPPDEAAAAPATEGSTEGAAPITESTVTEASPSEGFEGLGEDFDDTVEVKVEAPKPDESKAVEEKPKPVGAKPSTEPAKPEAKVEPKAAEAKPATEVGPKDTAEGRESSPSEPQGLLEQLSSHRGEILEELSKTRFALSKEDEKEFTDALDVDATKALVERLPKVMSRVYYEAVSAAINHIQNTVPVMLQNLLKAQSAQQEAETALFKQFPGLNRKDHWGDIVAFSELVKQSNPKISQADLLSMVGAAVMAKRGIAASANGASKPKPVQSPAFVPAQQGAGVVVTREAENPFMGLGQDFDEE